ncbi:MAG: S-layer homology domain-containing protein, partial [Pseudomonadota bacterium]
TSTGVESTVGALTGEAVVGSTISGKMPNESVTIVFTYTRNNYGLTVIHSYEGETPITTTSEDRPYDSAVEEHIMYRNGYYLTSIETTVGDLTNETVYGYYISGKMPDAAVTIVFTYVKNHYEVHYLGGGPDVTGSLDDELSPYKYNTTVTVLNNGEAGFKKTGYHVIGWDRLWENEQNYVSKAEISIAVPDYYPGNTFTMPANDVYLSAIWAPNTDTQYTIETYLQENGEYPLTATSSVVKHDGTTGEPKTITVPELEGYRFDKADPSELVQIIAADGSTVFKLYYKKLYIITYKAGDFGILSGGTQIHKLSYGELYPTAPIPVPNAHYVFAGWTPELPGSVDTVTEDKTFTAYFTPEATTSYTVYYYKKGTTTEVHSPKVVTGKEIGALAEETAISISGYNKVAPTSQTLTLKESGNIIIFYYVKESTPDPRPRPRPTPVEVIEEPIPLALNTVDHFQYLQGYPDNTVRPEGNITREEVAAVFYRLLMDDYRGTIMTFDENFPDVEANTWSTKYIATLANGKILEGYEDGTFKPHNFITKAELAVVASRFDNLSPFEDDSFTDIAGHWANKYINSAAKKGWVKGNPDGTFKPDKYITRAEFATLVNNVLDRRVQKDKILEAARKFPDLPSTKWYYEAMMEAINSHLFNRLEDGYEEWTEITHPDIEL